MGLRNRVGIGLLVAALSGSAVAQPASVDEIAAKYIPFMSQPVSQTLNPLNTVVREIGPNDYDQKVYQSNKPSLVLFARNDSRASMGIASVFRALAEHYHEKINFYLVQDDKWPRVSPGDGSLLGKQEGLISGPSIIMYSSYDITNGKKAQNSERAKRLDIFKGGLVQSDEFIVAHSILQEWITTNLLLTENFVTRLNNSVTPTKIVLK